MLTSHTLHTQIGTPNYFPRSNGLNQTSWAGSSSPMLLSTTSDMSTVYQSSELVMLWYDNRIHAIMCSDRMSPTLPWITLYPPSPPTHPSSWGHLLPTWCHLHSPAPLSFPLRGYLLMLLIWLWGRSPALLSTSLCHGHLYLVGTTSAYQSPSCVCLSVQCLP